MEKNLSITPEKIYDFNKNVTFQIKEEELDIAKKWMQTIDVNIYRETYTEEKIFTVPIIREELVIEKKNLIDNQDNKAVPREVIRIPVSEEQIEFTKHRVALEDISIYKEKIEDIKHIEATLKREQAIVRITGSPKVIDK